MANWEKRRVGRTKLQVTSLGLGTATMGGSRVPMTIEERVRLVDAAWNAGVRYVDTAPFYGVGAAERATGDALRDRPRDEWVLSTKIGRLLRPRTGGGGATDGRLVLVGATSKGERVLEQGRKQRLAALAGWLSELRPGGLHTLDEAVDLLDEVLRVRRPG